MFILYNLIFALGWLLDTLLSLYFWVVIASAVLSWVNPDPYNPIVRFIRSVTEPLLSRVRRALPFLTVAGYDLSPIVVLLGIFFLRNFLVLSLYELSGRMRASLTGYGVH